MYGTPEDISFSDSIQTSDDESMIAIILKVYYTKLLVIQENPQLITQHKDPAPEIYEVK